MYKNKACSDTGKKELSDLEVFLVMSAMHWVKLPVLLYCIFLGLGKNESDALYGQLGLTKAEQAGSDSNFTSLSSFRASCSEIHSIFMENWCFSFSGRTPLTVMQLSQRNRGQCRLFNSDLLLILMENRGTDNKPFLSL